MFVGAVFQLAPQPGKYIWYTGSIQLVAALFRVSFTVVPRSIGTRRIKSVFHRRKFRKNKVSLEKQLKNI
jgi:hypothetical protein